MSEGIDPARYRSVLGHFPTGVVVVTGEGPYGLSCNSFTSVSLAPPLVAFCAAASSTTWPKIRTRGGFAVNFLGRQHAELCRRFSAAGVDRFEGVPWRPGPHSSPLLDHAVAHLECRLVREHPAGDHTIVVGEVLELDATEERAPLVFFRGMYGTFASDVMSP
jgi:3-hydroxy-9,10-secoandrosta-1,3,5(10)-triene-9,17-dione monooxygenase reductase component